MIHLPFPKQYLIFAVLIISAILFLYIVIKLSRTIAIRKSLSIPVLSRKTTKELVKDKIAKQATEPGKKYESFAEFCFDLPKYSIKDDPISRSVRAALMMAGIRFKQFAFFDESIGRVSTAWIHWTGKMLKHEKGEYFPPFECSLDVMPYNVHDSRPLMDKTKDHNWYDPEMNADLVAARTNANTLANFQKAENQQLIILIGMAVIIIAILGTWYMTSSKIDEIAKQAMLAIDAAKKAQGGL